VSRHQPGNDHQNRAEADEYDSPPAGRPLASTRRGPQPGLRRSHSAIVRE